MVSLPGELAGKGREGGIAKYRLLIDNITMM
jgi:hypothetical protein